MDLSTIRVAVAVLAAWVSVLPAAAQQTGTSTLFNALHGDRLAKVKASADSADDLALASQFLAEAKGGALFDRDMLTSLCETAFELSWMHAAGYDTAVGAMEQLAERAPDLAPGCRAKLHLVHKHHYDQAPADEKRAAATVFIETARAVARDRSANGAFNETVSVLNTALTVANDQALAAAGDDVRRAIDEAKQRLAASEEIRRLRARLRTNPNAADAQQTLEQIIRLQVTVMDDPAGAASLVDESTHPRLARLLSLATGAGPAPESGAWYELGRWYLSLAAEAPAPSQSPMLTRARSALTRYLAEHEQPDLTRAKAVLLLRSIDAGEPIVPPGGSGPFALVSAGPVSVASSTDANTAPPDTPVPMPMPVTPAGTDPPVPVPAPPAANDGPWEPLIPLVLAADDAVAGKWRVEDGKLIVESAEAARLRLPAQPTGSYRVRVTLVRTEGSSTISIILPVGDRSVRLMLSGFGGLLSGLGVIDGKIASENDTTVTMTAANRMENNKPQTIVATVRLAADGGAAGGDRVDIDLNGQPLIKWTGNRQSLSVQDAWRMRATGPRGIGVGAHLSQVRFEAVEVQVIDGELTRLRP